MNDKPSWSRRRFLSARGLGSSSGGLIGALLRENRKPPAGEQPGFGHWSISRRVMGCDFTIYLPGTRPDHMAVADAALEEIRQAEDLLTVHRADSPMSYVNAHAAHDLVRTDHRLFHLLRQSAEFTELTDGAFDVAAGALIDAWGFRTGPKRIPSDDEREEALTRTGMHHVELDELDQAVRFRVAGLEINLGSIGKGYGIDLAIERLRTTFGLDCAMIQGGNSSLRAIGEPASKGSGWLVGLQNPFDPSTRLATVCLRDRAMGTSGNDNQYFEVAGRRYGHVLDPRTGWPAAGLGSATVLADDAATADALATALFVMGLDKAADFCHNHPQFGALIVLEPEPGNDASPLPSVVTFNLPPEDVELKTGPDSPDT